MRKRRELEWQRNRRQKMTEDEKLKLKAKARETMSRLRAKCTVEKKKEMQKQNRERRRLSRLCKKLNNTTSNGNNGIDVHQNNFDCFMASLQWKVCSSCKKKDLSSCYDKKRCKDFHLFNKVNNMDPGDISNELKNLTFIEQQLIAKVHPVVSVYNIRKGEQYKYSGQVINFPQNVQEVCNVLPQKVKDIGGVLTVRFEGSDGYKDLNVQRDRVLKALLWLKANNPFYTDIKISEENIQLLPEDGNVYKDTNGYEVSEYEDIIPTDIEGVHYLSNTDIDDSDIEGIDFKQIPDITGISQKDKIGHSLGANFFLWPTIGVTPINEFSSPGYITMAFPHLFPYGLADYSNRENNNISLSKYIHHLMLFYDGRFAKDPRFRFFMMNSQMRWQALNVGNVFVKKITFSQK